MTDRPAFAVAARQRADGVRDQLLTAYATDRGYHDTRHLAEVLDRVDELRHAGEVFDHEAVSLAAWFHDAVYDGQAEAEERSRSGPYARSPVARPPKKWLAGAAHRAPPAGRRRRQRLRALRRRPGDPGRGAGTLRGVCRRRPPEYAHVPDELFRPGRAAVLRDLLAKQSLFHTAHAREHWEAAARANVEAELSRGELSCRGRTGDRQGPA